MVQKSFTDLTDMYIYTLRVEVGLGLVVGFELPICIVKYCIRAKDDSQGRSAALS